MKYKTKMLVGLVAVCVLNGCSNTESKNLPDYFNTDAFTGLVKISGQDGAMLLDYELDGADGNVIKIESCEKVRSLSENDVVTSQYKLYRLLSINCHAADLFLKGGLAQKTYFTGQSLEEVAKNMPAVMVPDLGGNSLDGRDGMTMLEHDTTIEFSSVSPMEVATLNKDGMHESYVLVARKDVNHDGIEDLILRLDWYVDNAFGSGSTLFVLTKESETAPSKILERYN